MTSTRKFAIVLVVVGVAFGALIGFSTSYAMKKQPKDIVIPLSQTMTIEDFNKVFSVAPDGQLPDASAPEGFACFQWISKTMDATSGKPNWATTVCVPKAA